MTNILSSIGLGKLCESKAAKIFEVIMPDLTLVQKMNAHEYINFCWKEYKKHDDAQGEGRNSQNGAMFELILSTLFIGKDLHPFYLQAQVAFVKKTKYDILFYSDKFGPVVISAKVSLRERGKQADLEGMRLKFIHRLARCYLVTLNVKEAKREKNRLAEGEIMGLDRVILASCDDMDILIEELKCMKFIESPTVKAVESFYCFVK